MRRANGANPRRLLFVLVAIAVFLGDQASKRWAGALPMWKSLPVCPPVLYIYHTTNDGVAWSLFRRHTEVFSVVAMAFCLGILILGRAAIQRSNLLAFAMGLLFGGALGNLLDRIRLHYVVDFIDVHLGSWYDWPTFNVADSAITTGMILLAGYFWLTESRSQQASQPPLETEMDAGTVLEPQTK